MFLLHKKHKNDVWLLENDTARLFYRKHFGYYVLTFASPGERAHVAFPTQFNILAGAAHQRVGYVVVGYGEFELV